MELWLSGRISSVLTDAFLDIFLEDLELLDPDAGFELGDVVESSEYFIFPALVHDSHQACCHVRLVLGIGFVDGALQIGSDAGVL